MKQFDGFPAKMEFTPLPNIFFSALLPHIGDIAELKATLYVLAALYHKRGHPRFVTFRELMGNASVAAGLREADKPTEDILRGALEMATERGAFAHIVLDNDGVPEDVYFLNTEVDRQIVTKVQNGEFILHRLKAKPRTNVETEEKPDIFTLYEQNIGMLTPIIADELREAEKLYPEVWIRDAIKEAVNHSKHKWSYISAILERWSAEGKSDGTHQRHSKTDPDKYVKGQYGHMVQR
ncbi:DnaD domain protein [Chloroflexota bacterium]